MAKSKQLSTKKKSIGTTDQQGAAKQRGAGRKQVRKLEQTYGSVIRQISGLTDIMDKVPSSSTTYDLLLGILQTFSDSLTAIPSVLQSREVSYSGNQDTSGLLHQQSQESSIETIRQESPTTELNSWKEELLP